MPEAEPLDAASSLTHTPAPVAHSATPLGHVRATARLQAVSGSTEATGSDRAARVTHITVRRRAAAQPSTNLSPESHGPAPQIVDPEPSCEILKANELSLFLGDRRVGVIDVGRDSTPGLTFFVPAKKSYGGDEGSRNALRERAFQCARVKSEDKDDSRIASLAHELKRLKREAMSRDDSLTFGAKPPVPNAAVARMVLAALTAMREVLVPAMRAHKARTRSSQPRERRGGESGSESDSEPVEIVCDTGTNGNLFDRLALKDAGVELDTSEKHAFQVASGPDFTTDGKTKTPFKVVLDTTDSVDMNLNLKGHQADLGGSKGRSEAKCLLDVVKTIVMDLGLTFTLRKNKDGNFGGCIIDEDKGIMSPVPLNQDMLPVLQQKGSKPAYPSRPDSIGKLADVYRAAAEAHAKSFKPRSFHTPSSGSDAADAQMSYDAHDTDGRAHVHESEHEDLHGEWLDSMWAARAAANKIAALSGKPRTHQVTYNSEFAHNLLHRSDEANLKALKQKEVRFEDVDGKIKSGEDLTVQDLACGPCSICKQVRAVAPIRHAKGHFACRDCHGCTYSTKE